MIVCPICGNTHVATTLINQIDPTLKVTVHTTYAKCPRCGEEWTIKARRMRSFTYWLLIGQWWESLTWTLRTLWNKHTADKEIKRTK